MCPGIRRLGVAMVVGCIILGQALAQTAGTASMAVTLKDYNGSGAEHFALVWVTTESGTFIKTLWKQGSKYGFTSSQWTTHCPQWNSARGGPNGSTVVDGYTSATATSYAGVNSPVLLTWNCRDTNNVLVADGNYKFWVQYAEDNGAGPYTTSGLLWTKGAASATNTYPDQGANFGSMQVIWAASPPAAVGPTITSATPPAAGTVGVAYAHTATASGTPPIVFSASGLPPGLGISGAGVISGLPTSTGIFSGTITATNGTLPNAGQPFSMNIAKVPANIAALLISGNSLILSGYGPTNGVYAILMNTNMDPATPWTPVVTNSFDGAGRFRITNAIDASQPRRYYRLRVP